MNYKASLLIIFFLISVSARSVARAETVVKVGVYQNSPKIFMGENGTAEGIFIDILENIAEQENWHLEYIPGSWQECLDRLENKEIDLLPDMAYSDERAQRFDFNKRSVLNNWAVVYASRELKIESLLDLDGRKIAVMKGDISSDEFEKTLNNFGVQSTLIETSDFHTIFELLNSDSVDAGLISRLYGIQYEKQYRVQKTPIICCPVNLHFATTKGENQYLINTIDRHLDQMENDGKSIYYQSLDRWLGIQHFEKHMIPGWVWIILIIFGLGLCIVIFLVIFLRVRIKAATARIEQANVELYRYNRTLSILSKCNQALIRTDDELSFVERICEIIVDAGGYRMAWVGYAEQDDSTIVYPVAHAGFEEGYLELLNSTLASPDRDNYPAGVSLLTGRPYVVHDTLADPAYTPWRGEAIKCGYSSVLALPLMLNGRASGVLIIYSSETNTFSTKESQLLTELADDLTYGLTALRLRYQQREVETALRESEQKYRELVNNANSIIMYWTRDGVILFLNEFGQRFFGYTESEIYGRHVVGTIVPETESSGRDLATLMDQICSNPAAFEQNVNENVRRNGEHVWIAWTNRVELDENGQVAEILSIGQDLTARIQIEEELRETQANLEQRVVERTAELALARDLAEAADRTKSVFLATMSHELRTPLNSIIGFTGIILQGLAGPLNEEQNKQLLMVRDSARHLLALINDVLDISKIEAGQLEVHKEMFDLCGSIAKVTEIVRPLAEKKGLALQVKLAPEISSLLSDARRIEQVLLNLLNNAIKFTEQGTVTLTAEIRNKAYRSAPFSILISVADTGIGIRLKDFGKLFQPFRQIDSGLSRQHDGTGLGLAICRRLAELLDGDIRVESDWGKGSTFTLILPMDGLETT